MGGLALMDVQMPDGTIIQGVPEGTTKAQIMAKLGQSQPEKQKPRLARTIFDQAMQGATGSFADDISDRLGVVGATLLKEPRALITGEITDPALMEEVAGARQSTEARLSEQMRERPVTSIASNIGGGIATIGTGATTKAGAAVGNFLRSGNTAARAAKAIVPGAASGAIYGAGAAEDGDKAGGAKRGAVLGGVIGPAVPVLGSAVSGAVKGGKNIVRGIGARGEDALDDAADAIRKVSSKAYEKMRATGAVFTPQTSQRIVQNLDNALANDGPLNPRLHDKISAVMDDIRENGFNDLEQLDQWRQVLGDVAGNFSDRVNQRKAKLLINAIDDEIGQIQPADLSGGGIEAVDALMQGREAWARRARFETVANIVKGASGDANKLKRDLERLRLNKKKTAGWNADELAALKQAATQTTGEGVMKLLGKFGFDLGSGRAVGNTALPVASGLMAGIGSGSTGIGAIVPVVGTAARSGQKALAAGKAENLLRIIEQGGKVTTKQIMALPPKEANTVLTRMRDMNLLGKAKEYLKDESGTLGRMVNTPEFKRWFGKSKVVDDRGKPLVLYHGTRSDFDVFKPSKGGEFGEGIYFSDFEPTAKKFGGFQSGDADVKTMPVYLSLKNPLITNNRDIPRGAGQKKLIAQGYDGVIGIQPNGDKQYIAFYPTQIKSVHNRGTFDPTDPRIQLGVAGVSGATALSQNNQRKQ